MADNQWKSGTTQVFYWKDGTNLRLTDKSAVPIRAIVLGIYADVDHVPQSVIDEITKFNKTDLQLTQYTEKNKRKITDEIKTGKTSGKKTLNSVANDPQKQKSRRGLFSSAKAASKPGITVKAYDGGTYWTNGVTVPPPYTYMWQMANWWIHEGINPIPTFQPDSNEVFRFRTVAISGHYQRDHVEIRESLETRPGYSGIDMSKLNTAGKYNCLNYNIGLRFDSRNHYAYVGKGTYETVMHGVYETYFDTVVGESGYNTYNLQLGIDYLQHIEIGAKVGTTGDEYIVLSPEVPGWRDWIYEDVVEPKAEDVAPQSTWYWRDINTWANDNYTTPINYDNVPGHGFAGEFFAAYRAHTIGVLQEFACNRDETLHLAFGTSGNFGISGVSSDHFGTYYGFNLSDKDNFCMSRTKFAYGDSDHSELLIPKNSNPTVEVMLIPKKWHYIAWVYGLFYTGSSFIPKWLCTSFDGDSPYVGQHEYAAGADDINNEYGMSYAVDNGKYMYYNRLAQAGFSMRYDRYSHIYTPNGITYGPVFTDVPIDDFVASSLSLWLRLSTDIDGQAPMNKDANATQICPPAYSAWSCPRKAGQLVAIIRAVYSNGACDYRYVYSKTNDTANPTLQAYACIQARTIHPWVSMDNPGHYRLNFTPTKNNYPILTEVQEDVIPSFYVNLYNQISAANMNNRRIPG